MLSITFLNRIIWLGLVALCCLTTARAQDAAPAATPTPTSYSTLRGNVVRADTRQPARRVAVLLVLTLDAETSKRNPYNYNDTTTRRTLTDAQGNYSFTNIPAGRYALYATVPGALSPLTASALEAVEADAKLTDETAPPVEIAAHYVTFDGHNYLNADLTLPPTSSVTGRVAYPDGEPVVEKTVLLWRKTVQGLVLLPFLKTDTDDRGIYRIEDVPAGEYIAGVQDNFGTKPLARSSSESGFAAVYHPDALRPTKATPFTVSAGVMSGPINIVMPTEGLGRISGLVTWRIDGQPAQADINLRRVPDKAEPDRHYPLRYRTYQKLAETFQGQTANSFLIFGASETTAARTDERGHWELANLPAGKYLLSVTAQATLVPPKGQSEESSDTTYQVQQNQLVTISGTEAAEVTTQLSSGATIAGTVRQPDGTPLRGKRYFWLNSLRLTSEADGLDNGYSDFQTNEDGTFTARGLRPGFYQFDLLSGGLDYIASVKLNGRELPDQTLEVGPEATLNGVQITVAQDLATLEGRAVSAEGTPLAGVRVVALKPDWQPQGDDWPVQSYTASQRDGSFTLTLPPGRWLISTMPRNIDYGAAAAEFWRLLAARAQTVTLAPQQKQTLTLTITSQYPER